MKPTKYPIYILSKGRWESRLTSKTLEEIGIPYRIVVESGEYKNYAEVIDPKKIITLPEGFRENPKYAIKDELGQIGGGIPARNFIWEHSIAEGHKKHWILDDNIRHFFRSHRNTRLRCYSSAPLRVVEDFTDRFENMMMAGLNYNYFVPVNIERPAYTLNTRIYSCILLDNRINHRWRGRYNEDTDLSLNILKDGHCTVLFNSFSCGKAGTHTMKGGNTEEIYKFGSAEYDNRLQFTKSLAIQHPDCVDIIYKWGRIHHHVNYDKFAKNRPIAVPGLKLSGTVDEYGLKLVRLSESNLLVPIKLLDHTVENFNVRN